MHGQGILYDDNETLEYEGYFKDGLRHGYGKAYGPQGTVSEQGWFQDGHYKGYRRVFNDKETSQMEHEAPQNSHPTISKISHSQQRIIGNQIQQSLVKSSVYNNLYVSEVSDH